MNKFQVSKLRFNEPVNLTLKYDPQDFKESEKFQGTFNTIVDFDGSDCYWNVSSFVLDRLNEIGAKAGDIIVVARKEGKGGRQFTEITLPGDIVTQKQNIRALDQQSKRS